MLERDDLLGSLEQLLDGLVRGESRLVVVQGGPGSGKSTLLAQIARTAARPKVTPMVARCAPDEVDLELGTVRQLLETLVNRAPTAGPDGEDLDWLAHIDRGWFDQVAAAHDTNAIRDLYWLTVKLATRKPLVLVIDDAQWADAASMDFLGYLVRRLQQVSVLLVLSLDQQEPAPRWPRLAQLIHDPAAVVWRLPPLSRDGIAALCQERLGMVDAGVVEACEQLTDGVPYLVAELLAEAARCRDELDEPIVETLQRCGPPSVAAVALARARRHGDEVAEVLARLSVLRTPLSLELAGRAVGYPPAQMADAVQALRRLSMVTVGDRVAVAPPLVKRAICRALCPSVRHEAEARAARVLAADGDRAEMAALHLLETYPAGMAEHVSILRDAAALSMRQGSAEVAGAFLQRALREPPPPELRGPVLAELGLAEMRYDSPAAVAHLRSALACTTEPEQRAAAALRLAHALTLDARTADAVAVLERELASTALPAGDDLVQRMHAELVLVSLGDDRLHRRVVAEHGVPETDRAALPAGGGPGFRTALAAGALREAFAAQPCGPVLDAVSDSLTGGLMPSGDSSIGLLVTGLVLIWGDDLTTADRFFGESHTESLRDGSVLAASLAGWMRGIVLVRRGDLTTAEGCVASAGGLVADRRWGRWRLAPLLAATDLAAERGTVAPLLAVLAAEGLTGDLPAFLLTDVLLADRGRLRVLDGDVRRGLADLREAGRRLESIGCVNPAVVPWRSEAALALCRLGSVDEAVELVEEELRLARRWSSPRPVAIALRRRGMLRSGPAGEDDLERSVQLLDGRGMPLEQARSLLALGRLQRLQRRTQQARMLLGEARTLALACGAGGVLARVDEELLAAGGRPRLRQETPSGPLTASEDRVARLAITGRTNDEIARELFVARRTIEIHLTNTYRKLKIRGRAELPAALQAMTGWRRASA